MNLNKYFRLITILTLLQLSSYAQKGKSGLIKPGSVWPDNMGNHIQAHGGGIIKLGKVYYWFGEYRAKDNDPSFRYVGVYSSENLSDWKFLKKIPFSDPENLGEKWVLERPKVYYNEKSKKFVMYMHLDDAKYRFARVGIAVSDKPDGEYTFVKSFRPLGLESRDIGQFIDDDGSAYLIFESRPTKGFYIARLSDDYLNVEKETAYINAPLEGGAIIQYKGLYYAIGSALTGWRPNPNKYATATSLSGPWSEFKHIAPPETNTYQSQSTMMLKVAGSKATTVIFMADQWKPASQWDSRYLWMPLEIGGGELKLPEPKPWKVNFKTGKAEVKK
ncbi:family 43 glycosylhydrolase [Desertivirga arenae]|uniref:family 43 glycosylhydrolase n=1 Tax=Desertivirga arenae TaxID=2810309 RepID=UPI001A95BCF7|nr:family 43 glycosylhydrolase [Pedobacter sp. SYSU D00823]